MRALQDIRKIIKLKILFSKKINAHCTSYNSYKFAGLGCTWCGAMLGCHFSFSLHRHNCRCWAAPSAPWLQVLKMAWVLGNVRNSVSQLCLGEMQVGPCGGWTCWTCHSCHSCHIPCHAESQRAGDLHLTHALVCWWFIFTHFVWRPGLWILGYNMQ